MSALFTPGPNVAFITFVSGVLLLYHEAFRPGKFIAGLVLGAWLSLAGIYSMAKLEPLALGLSLLAGALVCFAAQARYNTFFVLPAAATALLSFGFWQLFPRQSGIAPALAFPLAAVLGVVTSVLLEAGKRARRNKRADL